MARYIGPVARIIHLAIEIYSAILFGAVIVSWVAPRSRHPFVQFLRRATDPVLEPIRRILPAAGGIDFSPMVALLLLQLLGRLFR
ncbi:MAG: hypothetical protein B6A08_03090 [Sorangiineae bacterium NIC37A_2]|nr:MAG: hypothetical protein B6A08_03090 [Sorangiineae bacterium NIC37A_2]